MSEAKGAQTKKYELKVIVVQLCREEEAVSEQLTV